MSKVSAGEDVDYHGASGQVNLSTDGSLVKTLTLFDLWTIQGSSIVPGGSLTCLIASGG